MRFRVTPMNGLHVSAVLSHEEQALGHDAITETDLNAMRKAKDIFGLVAIVIDDTGWEACIGHVIYCKRKPWISVETLVVAEDFRRLGIAMTLMQRMLRKKSDWMVDILAEDCRLPAHLFLRRCGFKAVSVEDICGDTFYKFEAKGSTVLQAVEFYTKRLQEKMR